MLRPLRTMSRSMEKGRGMTKGDLISRQAVLDAIQKLNIPEDMCVFEIISHIEVAIATLPSVENKGEWIPIVTRPMTDEEKEYYTDLEYPVEFMMMYDCPMPDDGQEVLITTSTGYVTKDTYYIDEGGYFENYCDEGDVKAWQPLPEPYKAESEVKPNE